MLDQGKRDVDPSGSGPPATALSAVPMESVWVCLPTYNEAENLEAMAAALLRVFEEHGLDGTILVVDDDSPDGTGRIADRLAAADARIAVLHRTAKEGLGPAYRAGFRRALAGGADYVVEMDCDFSHDPRDLPRLVAAAAHADVVLGSRYVRGGAVADWRLARRLISRGGCWYARTVLGVPVRDLTGGFKCFRRRVLETLPLDEVDVAGYGFQIEVTYRALLHRFQVVEIPITFRDRQLGSSKMSSRIVLEAALAVPGMRLRKRTLSPGRPTVAEPVVELTRVP
jgi:dolichol-phosphate mannosyltransferase